MPNSEVTRLSSAIADKIIYPLVALLAAVALLVFIYGVIEYLLALNNIAGDREKGRWHMLYGVVGLFIIIGAWAILSLIGAVMCNGNIANCNRL